MQTSLMNEALLLKILSSESECGFQQFAKVCLDCHNRFCCFQDCGTDASKNEF